MKHCYIFYFLIAVITNYPLCSTAQMPTVTMQRVTGITHYSYADTVKMYADSLNFFYSGQRGSRFNPLGYNGMHIYGHFGFDIEYSKPLAILKDPYLPYNHIKHLGVQYDSLLFYSTGYTQYMHPIARYRMTYRDSLIQTFEHNASYTWTRQMITREQNGFPVTSVLELYDTAKKAWDTKVAYNSRYADGRLSYDSIFSGIQYYFTDYSYDDKKLVQISQYHYDNGQKKKMVEDNYTYTVTGRIERHNTIYFTGGIDTNIAELNTYDSKDKLINGKQYSKGTAPQNMYGEQTYHYNDSSELDTLTRYYYDEFNAFNYIYKTTFHYNSFHNPDSAYTTVATVGGGHLVPDIYHTYYNYEKHEVTVDIDTPVIPDEPNEPDSTDTPVVVSPLIIYPNPAMNVFTIRWNSKLPSAGVYVNIYNRIGQLVRRAHIEKARKEDIIDISGLSSGMYSISIITEGGGLIHNGNLSIMRE